MHRARILFVTVAVLIVSCSAAWAEILSAPLLITATVMNTCRVKSAAPIDLAAYDALDAETVGAMNGLGGISLECSAGTDAIISVGDDSHQDSFVTRVTWENTDQMTYEVYDAADHIAVASGQWDGPLQIAAVPPSRPRLLPVYDLLPDAVLPDGSERTIRPELEVVSVVF